MEGLAASKYRNFFFYALLIKGILFLIFAFLFNKGEGKDQTINYIFTYSRDYSSYIGPAVNLVDTGEYFEADRGQKLYAHKMPGMTPIFQPLYYFFDLKWGLTLLVILQYIIDSLCCVLLGIVAIKLFKTKIAFYIAFYIYAFSSIVSVSSHHAVSELFCTSFSIAAVYFILKEKNRSSYIIAGLFATWSVFFRPTSILLFLFLPLVLIIDAENKFSFKKLSINKSKLILFFLPFVVFEGMWIGRNYILLNRFIPAEISAENFGTKGSRAIFSMLLDMGGDLQSWNSDSEMRWFNDKLSQNYDSTYANSFPFPDYVTRAGISQTDLRVLRDYYYAYNDFSLASAQKVKLEGAIILLSKQISDKFKLRAPFTYYVIAPARTLMTLVFIKRPYGFSFLNNGFLEKSVRLWHFLSYYVAMVFFLISCLWIFRAVNRKIKIIAAMAFSHIMLYGFLLRFSENRYLVPMHPFLVLVSVGTFIFLFEKIISYKKVKAANQFFVKSEESIKQNS